ncbi:MAG: ATP-binding protein [Tepidimonas ignava]|uniref:ATP-binding protein n=1 Tax=Tepidimonas ignava TaxID=114249 RepID=UPI00391AFF85
MSTDAWPKDDPARAGLGPSWPLPGARDAAAPPVRLWRLLLWVRVLLALGLLALESVGWYHGQTTAWVLALNALFVVWTVVGLALGPPAHTAGVWSPLWLLTVWADLAVFAALEVLAPGGLNFTPLFVWPVLLAAVLGPPRLALGAAAAGTLVLLGRAAAVDTLGGAAWLQAGVTGTGLFAVALLAAHLTTRLAAEAAAARHGEARARLQTEVNRLIARGLQEGIVVTDGAGHPRYVNPAAARMLGVGDELVAAPDDPEALVAAVGGTPAWQALAHWLTTQPHPTGTHDLTLPLPDGRQRRVRVQPRLADLGPGLVAEVLLLQDLHALEQRIHTEKLAAMGRVSAAVAHEIRNPLAAIAQASALLQEDDPSAAQRRLLTLIEQNVRRLARTVDDVLEAARNPWSDAVTGSAGVLALDPFVDAVLRDWLAQRPQGARLQTSLAAPSAQVRFDPEHLRRVLVNLLDNADRHASASPGAIRVETHSDAHHAHLSVWSDSPPIGAPLRDHLFEPFASAHSRSSGLGLFLSRELCQRYHASLHHEVATRAGRAGNAFVVSVPLSTPSEP